MRGQDIDDLLETTFCNDPPASAFRDRVLRDSTVRFVHARRRRARWRFATLGAAAVLAVAASFLAGRYCGPAAVPDTRSILPPTAAAGEIRVPKELAEWLSAANMFRQLGMQERMARAVSRAGNLLPGALAAHDGMAADGTEDASRPDGPPQPRFEIMNRIMAQSSGD